MRVLIVGAGGHAQVVADILLRMKDTGKAVIPIGYVDDNPELTNKELLGLPVLGKIADLTMIPHDRVIVAIGNNQTRERLFTDLRSQGEEFSVARHPSAVIAPDVHVDPGTMICANVAINPGSVIGSNTILNTACTIDHHNQIGAHVHIAPGAHLGGDITIGEGSLVGIGATVMPQCSVGNWCTIGAGALVHEDLPDGVTAVGIPARVI